MTTLSPPKPSPSAFATFRPGLRGLVGFCETLGVPLEPYQRRIARLYFGPEREMATILPRGNAKTTTAALIGLHHLVTTPGAAVTIGAASRDQARICFERMRGFAQHPVFDELVTIRHLELRHEAGDGLLRVIPTDGPRAHGLSSTLYIADELWAWKARTPTGVDLGARAPLYRVRSAH
jgi:phage terminase large subunit-like protein